MADLALISWYPLCAQRILLSAQTLCSAGKNPIIVEAPCWSLAVEFPFQGGPLGSRFVSILQDIKEVSFQVGLLSSR